ncbi:hypothetical protein ACM6XU_000556 [Vibrio parahaemolyticus]
MLDKKVYDFLKKNKNLKNFVKYLYQLIFSYFGRKKGNINISSKYKEFANSFFGFHDRPSLNEKGELLSHRMLDNGDFSGTIDVIDTNDGSILWSGSTKCFSRQQASLLTWFDSDQIIFNDFDEKPITVIKNIRTGQEKKLDFHFYSVSSEGRFLTSINFLRYGLGLEGYGYDVEYNESTLNDGSKKISQDSTSDLIIYDLNKNTEVARFSICDLIKKSRGLDLDGYFYFSHTDFSPSARFCYFLLRSSNERYNSSQLFVYDLKLCKLFTLDTDGMVSHLSWLGDSKIVAFCKPRDLVDGYYVFDLVKSTVTRISDANLIFDGHPHAVNNDSFFTDTYPDRERRQKLFHVDLSHNKVEKLLDLYSPMRFSGIKRVDLHPRLSRCCKFLTVDTSHKNKHCQLVISLDKLSG